MIRGTGDYLPPEPTYRDYLEAAANGLQRVYDELTDAVDYFTEASADSMYDVPPKPVKWAASVAIQLDEMLDQIYALMATAREWSNVRS